MMRVAPFIVAMTFLTLITGDTRVSCVFNESCVLPCSFQSGSGPVIHWFKTKGDVLVHSYYDQDLLSGQNQDFKDRTSLFVDQISRGNASLLLREVKLQDEGTYMCFISTSRGIRVSYINLKVFVLEVSCGFMESCVLPCSFQSSPNAVIHWSKTPDYVPVHSYYHGQDKLSHQHREFKDRTSLFVDQISRGNASLLLREVKLQDEGTYRCFTSTSRGIRVSYIKLKVFVLEVSCGFMESCVLPCSFQSGPNAVINWFKTPDYVPVHSYYHGQDELSHQHREFKDRTSLFLDQISRGNASLLLREVKVQDEGTYMCSSGTSGGNKKSLINLKVFENNGEVSLTIVGSDLICSSEGIYPKPDLTWSFRSLGYFRHYPAVTVHDNTIVHQNEHHLYSISSSILLLQNIQPPDYFRSSFLFFLMPLKYSCNISTDHSWSSTTFTLRAWISVFENEATIPCSAFNSTIKSLIWKFNLNETILNRTGADVVYNESWRQFVDGVSESGRLILKNLTSDHQGVYSCHFSSDRETHIIGTPLEIGLWKKMVWATVLLLCIILAVGFSAALYIRHMKKKNEELILQTLILSYLCNSGGKNENATEKSDFSTKSDAGETNDPRFRKDHQKVFKRSRNSRQ